MRVENYSDAFKDDVICLIKKFHVYFLQKFDDAVSDEAIEQTIFEFTGENARNAFLLVVDEKCVGLLAGTETKSRINNKLIYSEIFWFVDEPYGRYAFWFIHKIENILKERGFNAIIMAVLSSDKEDRITKTYKTTGYKYLETHYIKNL